MSHNVGLIKFYKYLTVLKVKIFDLYTSNAYEIYYSNNLMHQFR